MVVEFGNELSKYNSHHCSDDDFRMKIYEVNRAIDCFLLYDHKIELNFNRIAIDACKLDEIFHPILEAHGIGWLEKTIINSDFYIDQFSKTIESYFNSKLKINVERLENADSR